MLKISAINHLFVIAALTLPSSAISREINYDHLQGTYSSYTDSSLGTDIDADGFSVAGSFGITPNIAITASYGTRSYDKFLGLEIDFTEFTFGLTAYTSITPGTDIFGNFSVLNVEGEIDDGFTTITNDDTGNTISVGLRHIVNNTIELDASLTREDIFDDTSNIFSFGARFYANDKFSIGVGYRTGNDDVDAILFNARIDIK